MHRCLHVTDIVDLIAEFSQFHIPFSRQASATTLALARTCKVFYDPALNVYWRALESLRPLMALFPEDVCAVDDTGFYHFKRNPSPDDWRRFYHHAARVRLLHCSDDNIGIGAVEYEVLKSCRPDPTMPLIPHLRELYWDDFRPAVAPFVRLFIQSSLCILHTISISDSRLITAMLADVTAHAPLLTHLKIRSPRAGSRGSVIAEALSKALPELRYLSDVAVSAPLTGDHLAQLAALGVKSLSAPLDPDVDITHLLPSCRASFFPALFKLDITARHLSQVTALLLAVCSRGLRSLGLHLEEQPTHYALHDFLEATSAHPHMQDLSVRVLVARRPDADLKVAPNDHLLTDDTLRPLLALHELTNLYMIQLPFQIRDCFVRDAAAAWPCIERLTLGTMVRYRTSGVTLDGLRPLSQKCRRLRQLAIAVDVPPGQQDGEDTDHHAESSLETFDIGCTPLCDTNRLVQFMMDTFRNAKVVDTQAPSGVDRKQLLEAVNNTLTRVQDLDAL